MSEVVSYHVLHFPLDPSSRRVRLALAEKGLNFELTTEPPWERRPALMALNPAGEVPVLQIKQADKPDESVVLCGVDSICEYIEETAGGPLLLGNTAIKRAETRRLVAWFDRKFAAEVTDCLLGEKALRGLRGQGGPDPVFLRVGYANIHYHLDYIAWLCERRRWLAGEAISMADLAAAAHLSALDYLGDVPWDAHAGAREWYARLKSRPAFRPLLGDHVPGIAAAAHYADLDF
ncbi:MAG: glutathione S-transferase family protein [Alphaproteobacteria bacterium]|nr:MAG: glutathione S-transferase family protein [Alphaproteobacteria bacterium]